MSLIPSYNFLFNNKDYFLEHNLGDLPIQYIQRIGDIQNCEVVHGVMAILQRWKMLYSTSTEYI
jgi:predicted transcriptional regulator